MNLPWSGVLTPLDIYRKVSALALRDGAMLLITASASPGTYTMPGGPLRGTHPTITLAEALQAELGVSFTHAELFGEYEVRSTIDGVLVRSWVYRVELDGEPRAVQPGRHIQWATSLDGLPVSSTVAAVRAHAAAHGLVGTP